MKKIIQYFQKRKEQKFRKLLEKTLEYGISADVKIRGRLTVSEELSVNPFLKIYVVENN